MILGYIAGQRDRVVLEGSGAGGLEALRLALGGTAEPKFGLLRVEGRILLWSCVRPRRSESDLSAC